MWRLHWFRRKPVDDLLFKHIQLLRHDRDFRQPLVQGHTDQRRLQVHRTVQCRPLLQWHVQGQKEQLRHLLSDGRQCERGVCQWEMWWVNGVVHQPVDDLLLKYIQLLPYHSAFRQPLVQRNLDWRIV
jgi:hypothetical protein